LTRKKDINFDLKQIRSYLEIIKEGSFTRAARNLKIGKATISHHIGLLEESLNAVLIHRTSRDLSVTAEGKVFQEFCESLFNDIDNLRKNLVQGTTGGLVKIASSTIPAAYMVPGVVGDIRKERPQYYFKIETYDSRETIEMVREGKADIGITGRMIKHPSLVYEKIYSDTIMLVGADSYPDAVTFDELRDIPFVERESGSGTRAAYEKFLLDNGVMPSELTVVFECSTSESVKEAVITGMGVSFISSMAVGREEKQGALKRIKLERDMPVRDFFIVYQKNSQLSGPADFLLQYIKEKWRNR